MKRTDAQASAKPPARRPRVRRATGRVTLEDVARIAAVSSQTVSRVLNTPDKVPPETLAHVRAAIQKAGYVAPANPVAAHASERSKLVAALVPTISGAVFGETVVALTKALARNGYQMMLGESGYEDEDEDALLDNLIRRRPDGIVLTRIVRSEASRQKLRDSRIAVVESWDLTPTPIDMLIGFSHAEVGKEVARYFQQQGHRFPGLIIGDDPRAKRRGEAYVRALNGLQVRKAGLEQVPVVRVPAPASLGSGRSGLAQLLEQCPQLDAVFCSTDMVSLGVLIEARKRGLRVPQDLAVMGFADLPFAPQCDPPLSTVRIDGTAIGQRAAQFIMSRAEGWPVEQPIVDIGFTLVRRDSA